MKVIQITSHLNPDIIRESLDPSLDFSYIKVKNKEDILQGVKEADILISIYEDINREVLDQAPNLKFIAMGSIGYNFVDIDYAREKNIPVANNPNYCIEEVADHAVGMIIDRARRISDFSTSIKKDHTWDYQAFGNSLYRLSGKTLGLVGLGKIGRGVAKRLGAFGMKIMAYDPYVGQEVFDQYGVERVDLETIRDFAHVVSIHVPLSQETQGLIGQDFFQGLKKPIILVNTARGAVVDQEAMVKALEEGKFLGLGLDVLDSEDPDIGALEFIQDDRVLVTPHVAFYSQESNYDASYFVAQHVNAFLHGKMEEIPIVNEEKR